MDEWGVMELRECGTRRRGGEEGLSVARVPHRVRLILGLVSGKVINFTDESSNPAKEALGFGDLIALQMRFRRLAAHHEALTTISSTSTGPQRQVTEKCAI